MTKDPTKHGLAALTAILVAIAMTVLSINPNVNHVVQIIGAIFGLVLSFLGGIMVERFTQAAQDLEQKSDD